MDIFIPIVICFILFVFFTLCGMCCKRRRDAGAVIATPVVITSTQHHVGPYPVSQTVAPTLTASQHHQQGTVVMQQHGTGTGMYPMPQPMAQPMPGFNTSGQGYPPQQQQQQQSHLPYPNQPQMPMPMPMPGAAAVAPPMPTQAMMNPPSYDQVVTEGYARQAPFNPNYSGQ